MFKRFIDYVEIRTKITSTFVFLMSIGFLLYQKVDINWKLTSIFFGAMFLFDLTTTAINNYIDTKTNQQTLQFKRKTALMIIYVLFGISAGLGLYLAFLTDIIVFLIGGLCFMCGVLYTYGPLPISRQPLGEILSGIFYGLLIPFIILYINMPVGSLVILDINLNTLSLELQIIPLLSLLLLSIIPTCVTANIMLANNICDLEKDIIVKRHTLPYYLGKKALILFGFLYYVTYIAVILMVVAEILSPISLLFLITIVPVHKNIKAFYAKQEKASTFSLAIKNYIIIMGTNTILLYISAFIHI